LVNRTDKQRMFFSLRKGEILGIGGLVGSGRTEVLESLFGLQANAITHVKFDGKPLSLTSPRKAIKQGWGMVPEDRKKYGGLLNLSIRDNISLANLNRIANKWGFIKHQKEEQVVNELVKLLHIKLGNINDPLYSLSGGNQ